MARRLFATATRFSREAVELTLTPYRQGGIYDHLGGGFARYSVDERWLVPHFEKMLYDNAQLVGMMTEAWRETKSPLYAARIAETIDWLMREMLVEQRSPEGGGFASSLDADSEGEEGKFYVWSLAEIEEALGAEDAKLFAEVYDVTAQGNFEGHNILNRLDAIELRDAETEARLAAMREKLARAARGARAPGLRRQGARRLERIDDRGPRQRGATPSTAPTGSKPPSAPSISSVHG